MSGNHLRFNRRQRAGLMVTGLLLVVAEAVILYWQNRPADYPLFRPDSTFIGQMNSAVEAYNRKHTPRIYPFNPNYLSDYKAYILGIDTAALARIRKFREQGKYFRSKREFQSVAGLPDSLYRALEPYIRIPEFRSRYRSGKKSATPQRREAVVKQDINTATAEALKKVYGIGDKLSVRIVRYRKKLGGFSIPEQLKDIYALSDEAYRNLWKYFYIATPKKVDKISLNRADIQQLRRNPYIDFDLAERIVEYRSLHGKFRSLEELKKVPGFPVDKYKRITLYLQLN